jgi:hypothetical protein
MLVASYENARGHKKTFLDFWTDINRFRSEIIRKRSLKFDSLVVILALSLYEMGPKEGEVDRVNTYSERWS